MQLFMRFNEVGVTVLIATHDLKLIDHLGQNQFKLLDGKLMNGPDDFLGIVTQA